MQRVGCVLPAGNALGVHAPFVWPFGIYYNDMRISLCGA